MNDVQFIIGDVTYTVNITHFDGGSPGNIFGLPEDCYPEEGPEVGFGNLVDYAMDDEKWLKTMEFEEFVRLYASDRTKGDISKAIDQIEEVSINAIIEEDMSYHE